jgi:hypothetical protein
MIWTDGDTATGFDASMFKLYRKYRPLLSTLTVHYAVEHLCPYLNLLFWFRIIIETRDGDTLQEQEKSTSSHKRKPTSAQNSNLTRQSKSNKFKGMQD